MVKCKLELTGSGCSKLTTSLVNLKLNIHKYAVIFDEKRWESFALHYVVNMLK